MKKPLVFLLTALALFGPSVSFGGSDDPAVKEEGRTFDPDFSRPLYEYEPDESERVESLNRIAGEIDRGFSSPEQSFKAEDQYKPGPFARERSAMKEDQTDY